MRAIFIVAMAIALAGCTKQPAEPKDLMARLVAGDLSSDDLNKVVETMPGMTPECIERVRWRGINAIGERVEDCVQMTVPRRWTGLWRAAFEGSQFCADEAERPATQCEYKDGHPNTWFEPGTGYTPDASLYRVDFIGRRTVRAGHFGHMGMSDHEMIVDRMISMKEVEAPPPLPTRAEMIKYWKACEAEKSCIPNWSMINAMEE
jgi:hypothetical protein